MARKKKTVSKKAVETITHDEAKRRNIPTAEYQSVMQKEQQEPLLAAYERRNRDLDPQLVWRGKDMLDWSDLVVQVPPLYIQEKIHPKVLIDDLRRQTSLSTSHSSLSSQLDLFADFNGLPDDHARTEFYQHDQNWSNRMILGDSLQVMASLAEREGLRGKVQCIYIDPPYGIKFNSNFQWSTTSRDVKDGKADHITREPEQVKAFRDTWRDGIHSYLTYLRDRLTVARDLLADSGSIFVQIGDENVHRVRAVMDEVFGDSNHVSDIIFQKTTGASSISGGTSSLAGVYDIVLWYAKGSDRLKYRQPYLAKEYGGEGSSQYTWIYEDGERRRIQATDDVATLVRKGAKVMSLQDLTSASGVDKTRYPISFEGQEHRPGRRVWRTSAEGMKRVRSAGRVVKQGKNLWFQSFIEDFAARPASNIWTDCVHSFLSDRTYVVQTSPKLVERCLLMATDPGDLVLDPTCGSGTTAYVAEQWGRRWITIDTSRVALALARTRIMGARYPYYLLSDSKAGQEKEAELTRTAPSEAPTYGDIRQGFVYERVPHITLKSIANNAEIDVIWERWQLQIAPLLEQLSAVVSGQGAVDRGEKKAADKKLSTEHHPLSTPLEEWQVSREFPEDWPADAKPVHARFWEARIARQKEIDASIAAKAEYEYLYDKPYEDKKTVRVAGPFTVESLSPHRVLGVDEDDELIDQTGEAGGDYGRPQDFATMILENLRRAGVQQAHKEDKIVFTSLTPWPGEYICAEGRFEGSERWIVDSGRKAVDSGECLVDSGRKGVDSGECLVDSGRKGVDGKSKQSTSHQSLSTKHYLRAGILIGPEFGTVTRPDLVAAAREAGDADFDVVIACAFNYDAHASEFNQLGRVPVLKARMNADLHMAEDLKNTGKGNLFVIFGEPDIELVSGEWLVTSGGRMVAHYGTCKELSGLGSLEEINELGGTNLPRLKELSVRGKVRLDQSDSKGGGVGAVEHRGGSGPDGDGGVSAVSERGKRVAGGSGDAAHSGGTTGIRGGRGTQGASGTGGRNKPNAGCTQALAAIKELTPGDFPLSLTTNHYAQVTINGVDVFHPNTGEVRSDGAEGIACWFIDTDYNEESFFVRHAYFLGANDPYKSLKTTLKAEINEDAWESLHSDTSRPFDKPASGRIAVKVINHLGDEVMKVFRV